ncbi:MAG: hypothetical protein HC897_15735 [Thermoanaerobaculia bacterium]|nr:hypothetical protein [Thermoanaerobaculia bacterium]
MIPLNDRGCRLLAGKQHVRLALRIETESDRPPLRFARARFDSGDE